MTTAITPPKAILTLLLFLAVSVHVAPAVANSGDYSNYDDLTEAVLSCEEAVSALAECCPGFDRHGVRCVDHRYRRTGCEGQVEEGHELPSIGVASSRCIREASCAELASSDTCARASKLARSERQHNPDAGPPARGGACL